MKSRSNGNALECWRCITTPTQLVSFSIHAANVPLDFHVRSGMDAGKPIVVSDPDSRISELYKALGRKVLKLLNYPDTPGSTSEDDAGADDNNKH